MVERVGMGSGRNSPRDQLESLTGQTVMCLPNRNLAHCLDVSSEGFIAFGSENRLLIVEQPSLTYRYQFIFDKEITGETTSRVTVVRFARESPNLLMCTTEHVSYFFNLATAKLERDLPLTNEETLYGRLSAGDWRLIADENKMVAAFGTDSNNGYIAVRMLPNSDTETLTWFSASQSAITCLEICQHDPSLIAIGTRNGAVCVCNWMTRSSIHFMDSGEEVTSLTWSPKFDPGFFRFSSMNNQSPVPDEFVLLTASKDGYLRFWSLAEGFMYTGRKRIHAIRSFQVEKNKPDQRYNPRYNRDTRRRWVALCWNGQRPLELYYCDFNGNVNCLNIGTLFNRDEHSMPLLSWFKKGSRTSYAYCLRYCSSKDVIVSLNDDRKLNVYNATNRTNIGVIVTDTGSVTCLAINSEQSGSAVACQAVGASSSVALALPPRENVITSNGQNAQGGFSEGPNNNDQSVSVSQDVAHKPKIVLIPTSKDLNVKSENINVKPILVKKHKYKETTLFEFTCRNDSVEPKLALQDILTLLELSTLDDIKARRNILNEKPYLNFYLDQKGAMSMFRDELDEQLIQGDPNIAAVIAAAGSMIPRLARSATENNLLNQFITALTASDSGSNTKNVTFIKYAGQLNGEKEYLKASAFYFGAFNTKSGIRCLLDAKCCRDAVLAARIRLAPTDELAIEAHEAWASKFFKDRCFEAAAKCYISANDYISAADALIKRETPVALQVAVKLALKVGKKDLAISTGIKCVYTSMIENVWSVGLSTVDLCPELEPWRFVIHLHEGLLFVLTQNLSSLGIDAFQNDMKIFGEHLRSLNEKNFIHSMWHLWLDRGLKADPANLTQMLSDLSTQAPIQPMSNLKSILPSIAFRLSSGILGLLLDPWKSHSEFASSLESISLFADVSNVVSTIVNDYATTDYGNKCCDVDAALAALSTGAEGRLPIDATAVGGDSLANGEIIAVNDSVINEKYVCGIDSVADGEKPCAFEPVNGEDNASVVNDADATKSETPLSAYSDVTVPAETVASIEPSVNVVIGEDAG